MLVSYSSVTETMMSMDNTKNIKEENQLSPERSEHMVMEAPVQECVFL